MPENEIKIINAYEEQEEGSENEHPKQMIYNEQTKKLIAKKIQEMLKQYIKEHGEEEEEYEEESEPYNYNENYKEHIFLAQSFQNQTKVQFQLQAGISLLLTSISYGVQAQCKATQCITLSIEGGMQDTVIARLIPNRNESQQLDLEIPDSDKDRKITFQIISEDGQTDDIDFVGMLYQNYDYIDDDDEELRHFGLEDEEEFEDSASQNSQQLSEESDSNNQNENNKLNKQYVDTYQKSNKSQQSQPSQQQIQSTKSSKNSSKTQSENEQKISQQQNNFYNEISKIRHQEHLLDKSANLTKISYTDETQGKGKVADRNSVVTIQYKITDENDKIIEQTQENDLITFQLNQEISEGMKRIIVGMREGGIRKASGPRQEIYGNEPENQILKVEIKLLKVK